MTVETQPETRERSRVFITGQCDGLNELSEALGRHTEVELIGRADQVREGRRRADRRPPPGGPPRHEQLGASCRRDRGHPRVHAGADRPPRLG